MGLRSEYSLGNSEFNDFLFAFIDEENDDTNLTVLSALSRLDLDPWAEAARLSKLTTELAINALSTAIQSLPNGDWTESDLRSTASRLVGYLPKHASSNPRPSPNRNPNHKKQMSEGKKKLIWIAVGVGLIFVLFLTRLFGD
ncbi:MAG: hypothetical protein ACPGPC_15365 [Alphaproteobacteria bacterium]|jgi:hypothetical protein